MAHCHRELTHEQWRLLLDNEFLHAYEHGIVMQCGDGVMRRFHPRIFTYSADYPEKYVRLISHACITCLNFVIGIESSCQVSEI